VRGAEINLRYRDLRVGKANLHVAQGHDGDGVTAKTSIRRTAATASHKPPASQQSVMPLASKLDRETSGKIPDPSRSLALGSKDDLPAVRSKREPLISLHLVANRPARVGDELVSTQFRNPLTRGFVAIGEPDVAVCLLPGTEVAFEARRGMRRSIPLFSRSKSQAEGRALPGRSIFDEPTTHCDGRSSPMGR
jgi:hypothetical protein